MLRVKGLSFRFGETDVLHDIDLDVRPGEVVTVIGPNGAGKSTLIRVISGVLTPQAGTVQFNDQPLTGLTPQQRARIVAVVPQARQLGGAFTVQQAVMMGRTAYMDWLGTERPADREIVARVMRETQVEHLAERRIATLSGGEQQRVLFARALAQTPELLLLDEPTNHLDIQHQTAILDLARAQAREHNLAVLMALHDLNLVALYADRVLLLHGGQIVAHGTPDEVLTAEQINQVYDANVQVVRVPGMDVPVILPDRRHT